MAEIREIPNTFKELPVGLVQEWLAHPVTEKVRLELLRGLAECDKAVLEHVYCSPKTSPENLTLLAGINQAYQQVKKLFAEAHAHVKAGTPEE